MGTGSEVEAANMGPPNGTSSNGISKTKKITQGSRKTKMSFDGPIFVASTKCRMKNIIL